MQEHPSAGAWESLIPKSFKDTIYIPALKISVTAGSFIRYGTGASGAPTKIGRIVNVVMSKDLIDDHEVHPLINLPRPDTVGNEVPVQFARVNVFKDRRLLCDTQFQAVDDEDDRQNRFDRWQKIVQLDECEWVSSYFVNGLAFVVMESDAISMHHECQGMRDFFLAKYRIAGNGNVCIIPPHSCPQFAGCIEDFRKIWSVDFCELIFMSMLQIRREVQRILCRVAQSQGDFAVKNTKLHVSNCCWFFIKNAMEAKGIHIIPGVRCSQPRSVLSWGLAFHSRPHTSCYEVLRFDTAAKLHAFRGLFGTMSGYGVRKKRPKYSDGHSRLCMNDVLNVVVCPIENAGDFQRFVSDDGIDLAYDVSDGVLQIVVRYRKVIVTDNSLPSLVGVGVRVHCDAAAVASSRTTSAINIVPGMEFIDNLYVMRVQKVCSSEIRAKKIYRIDEATRKTTIVTSSEIIIYNDIAYINRMIQQMIE